MVRKDGENENWKKKEKLQTGRRYSAAPIGLINTKGKDYQLPQINLFVKEKYSVKITQESRIERPLT